MTTQWSFAGLLATSLAAILVLLLTGASPFSASADHDPGTSTVDIYGFDMVPGTNTALEVDDVDAFGNPDIQACVNVAGIGTLVTVDVILDDVPLFTGTTQGLGGYSGTVLFDGTKLKLLSYTTLMLFAAAPVGILLTAGTDSTPDTDGAWNFSQGEVLGGIEDGDGVAMRLVFEVLATGIHTVSLGAGVFRLAVSDVVGAYYTINNTPSGEIRSSAATCPTPTPLPTPTPPPGDTPTGDDVSVPLEGGLGSPGGIELSFSTVTGSGTTTVTKSTGGPPPPTGLKIVGSGGQPVYYDINTTATFSGIVTVCIAYDETQVAGQESNLKLMHDDGSGFTDITSSLDTTNDIICGETATLSPFALMVPAPVGGLVELVTHPSDTPDAQPAGQGPQREVAALAVALAAVGVAGVSWHRYRRRAG